MALTRLPGSKWWIETDDVTFEIVGTYNKTEITARIQTLRNLLATYPDFTRKTNDYNDLLTAIGGKWTTEKNARIVAMIGEMWDVYNQALGQLNATELQAELDTLIALRERLV